MDNKSSVGGENFSGAPDGANVVSGNFEQDFGPSEFEKRAEQRNFGSQAELGRGALEAAPFTDIQLEVGASAAELGYGDANAQMTEVDGKILGTDLRGKVKIGDRLDERIVEMVKESEREIEENPNEGLLNFSKLREWYHRDVCGRTLGERNDGGNNPSLNMLNDKPDIPGANTQSQKQRKVA